MSFSRYKSHFGNAERRRIGYRWVLVRRFLILVFIAANNDAVGDRFRNVAFLGQVASQHYLGLSSASVLPGWNNGRAAKQLVVALPFQGYELSRRAIVWHMAAGKHGSK